MASLAGLLADPTGEVQVRALADGSVWIITSQEVYRWDGQALQEVVSGDESMLAAVDDGGRLWVLHHDTSEISAWQDGQWTTYAADNGWANAGYFEKNWWAPSPWRVSLATDGTLWVPMAQDVRSFDGNAWSLYTLADMGFPLPEMEDLSVVHDLAIVEEYAEVWVGECYYSGPGPMGGGGVRWFDGQAWHGEDAPAGIRCVSAMEVDPAGNVWLGAYDVIWRYEHASQSWTDYPLPETLLSDFSFSHPRQLILDQAGDVWVIMQMCGGASCDGPVNLYRIHDGEWSLIIGAEYWGASLKQIALDGSGGVWLFWEGTVYQLNDKSGEPFARVEARGVGVSPDGTIWVVAGSGDNPSLLVFEP